ncbi:MAG TPA: hypothetical protein VNU46_09575, partial [Gemmatimonadaceae bacterium]|nr:hypothetical protein [Gemmatimonadaceae bacterium]
MDSPRSRPDEDRLQERCGAVAPAAGPHQDGGARLFRLLGLGARGGLVVVGVEQVRKAVFANKLRLAVVAANMSHN